MAEGDDFRFHLPLTVWEKSDDENPLRIGGIVSTDTLDRQGEVVIQDGLDFSPFLTHGWFNDNHGQRSSDVLGYPTTARRVSKGEILPNGTESGSAGWWTEGYLLNTNEGRKVFALCNSLQGNDHRRLGFSIEGKVVERDQDDSNKILSAEVRNVAVTHCPVNTDTEMHALAKALTAGSAVASPGAVPGSGFALRGEDLDRGAKKKKKKKGALYVEGEYDEDDNRDGGDADHGGVAGENPHLRKANEFVVRPMAPAEYIDHWGDSISDFVAEPESKELTKSEAYIIVAAVLPHLTETEVSRIVQNAAGEA